MTDILFSLFLTLVASYVTVLTISALSEVLAIVIHKKLALPKLVGVGIFIVLAIIYHPSLLDFVKWLVRPEGILN